jgi:ribose transport system substrate-binding protein
MAGCNTSDSPDPNVDSGSGQPRIVVIPKGTTHEFWNSVKAGAEAAGKELNVEIVWRGPLEEGDRAGQIKVVQQFVSEKVDGIVLAPVDSKALVGPVQQAAKAGIPVVIIDSGIEAEQGKDFVSFVATDNYKGGQLAGEALAKALGEKGKVVLLRYMAGSDSTANREKGFLEAIAKYPDIELISDNQYAGDTSGAAQSRALNMTDVLKEADGVFCPNESSTEGMLQALRKIELAGKIKFVGFDSSKSLLNALEAQEIQALIVQNPRQMGYLGVKTMLDHRNSEPIEPIVDTGVVVVTLDNLETAEIKELLGR